MNANELLKKYAAGERNFQRLNLRGQSFKRKDLSGADFSEADIRSANFTGANLRGANFTGAKCGLQKRWAVLLTILSWLLAVVSGFFSIFTFAFIGLIFNSDLTYQIAGWVSLPVLVIFLIVTIRQGIRAGAGAVAFAGAGAVAGVFIGWRAMKGDVRDAWVRSFAIAFAATGGTSFRGADLTDANFTGAKLKSTDLRKATLTRVRWYGAKMLDRARPGDTYLKSTQVRQWLIGKGIDKNFDGQKLQGINLQGADLTDASFIDANLSEANLQDADLSRTKLVQTQLDKTDFTGATLTGAFIEDWGITSNTVLNGVRCEYVFMRLPTDEDPDPCRKPDNRLEVFGEGDFGDFIQPIFDTLDLYHNQGVDPRAIAISFKELAENNPNAELEIVAMERKGADKFLLRAKTSAKANKSQLSADYFENYNELKALAAAEVAQLIEAKDKRIASLENMVDTALKRPGFYAANYHQQGDNNMAGDRSIKINRGNYNENIKGDYVEGNKTDQSRNLNISGGTVNASGAGAFSVGDINGTVANAINQLPSLSNPEEPGIKDLLTEIQAAIDDPQLSEDDKKQVLEQLQILAEAGKNPQVETMQKKAERAVGFLEVIAKGVEPASKLAKACAKVLPRILAFFV